MTGGYNKYERHKFAASYYGRKEPTRNSNFEIHCKRILDFIEFKLFLSFEIMQDNVEEFLSGDLVTIESALGAFNELYSKYKYMESSFERSKNVYKSKIPEIAQTVELIKIMMKRRDDGEEMITNYSLCDTIYAKAKVCFFYS